MSNSRVWFFHLTVEGHAADLENGDPFTFNEDVGVFDSPDEAKRWLKERGNGREIAASTEGFQRFCLTHERVNQPESMKMLMSLDVDGDEVEWGWKKI